MSATKSTIRDLSQLRRIVLSYFVDQIGRLLPQSCYNSVCVILLHHIVMYCYLGKTYTIYAAHSPIGTPATRTLPTLLTYHSYVLTQAHRVLSREKNSYVT